jgi:hypothetical protein
VLTLAAMRGDHLVRPPRLPIAAVRQVARSLLNAGLAEEVPASGETVDLAWPPGNGDLALVLRATAVGLARIADGADTLAALGATETMYAAAAVLTQTGSDAGSDAFMPAPTTGQSSASICHRARDAQAGPDRADGRETTAPTTVRAAGAAEPATRAHQRARRGDVLLAAAQALLDEWEEPPGSDRSTLARPVADLRAALVAKWASISVAAPRATRDTKHCVARMVPAGRRSPRRWVGRHIRSAVSSPVSPGRVSRSMSLSAFDRSARATPAPRAATRSIASSRLPADEPRRLLTVASIVKADGGTRRATSVASAIGTSNVVNLASNSAVAPASTAPEDDARQERTALAVRSPPGR